MHKRYVTLSILPIIILTIIGSLVFFSSQSRKTPYPVQSPHQTTKPKQKYRPLSEAEFQANRKIKYASIIYYAVKHVNIQRWQEVSDFKLGWQIESSRVAGKVHYLVWPDKSITKQEKQLTPNWFEISEHHVIYHSFEVHTSQADEDQSRETSDRHIIRTINDDQAATTVRKMSKNVVTKAG
ncbi:hypothetical protein [Lentilactobacillus kisonensis]|uniref:Uncharacterized protein n=2 Tax=Lentilactobacillus kisonensis TaxID=481722 RepID=H1LEI0_9LACO|nr:hypothetical protein [Lentilactobacillus kisonensis]EHO52447.1 hypothetical protein HMPREF9104_01006 [Lentilactobacillus kisonensis F0435]KRL22383.1 hypothetical protein FC98_GL002517 [Lentilactobacillus kisonensis DSM 19906 = JCM 15041]